MEDTTSSAARRARIAWFSGFFDEHYAHLVRYVERRIAAAEDAEQVAADAFEVAWQKLDTDAPDAAAWLYKTAQQKIYNYWTRQRRRARAMACTAALTVPPTTPEDSLDSLALHNAISHLNDREREVLSLTYWESMDAQDIADQLGISVAAVWKCASRARSKLRKELSILEPVHKPSPNPVSARARHAVTAT
ncbi:RNA polymerase sigma factor [Microbacterium luticocti]|uniref:RNA polymerase sigma factor n=1 Tax=Microbacterium luticocti TaxID=451764 RepID=UPI0009FC803F|nr:sigma-70 family RNA polymerase sigma factor [Microbacterium luticocti]